MTASRVFSGGGPVAEATRKRVLEVGQRLGYRPNQVARSLAQARTRTVGLVMTRGLAFPAALDGAEDAARKAGYSFLYTTPSLDAAVERERVNALLERRVDGLLVMSSSALHEHDTLRALHQSGVPLVTINRYCEELGFWRLFFNYRGAARAVVRRLLAAGHRRIAFVGGASDDRSYAIREQIEGYREALREAGAWTGAAESFGGVYPEDGEALMEALLDRCPEATAILAVNDLTAAGALRALSAHQRRVPEDMAVVGFDDTIVARSTNPPLTSVRHPAHEAGSTGCRLLIEQIEQRGEEPGTLVLPASLVIRQSCGLTTGRGKEEVHPLE